MTATGIRRDWYQPSDEQFLLYNGLMLHNLASFCTDAHDFVALISRKALEFCIELGVDLAFGS